MHVIGLDVYVCTFQMQANIVSSLELKAGPKQMMSMRKLSNPVRIEFAKSRKKYHRLVPEVDISCQPKSIILRNKKNIKTKKKANRHTDFRFVVSHITCL